MCKHSLTFAYLGTSNRSSRSQMFFKKGVPKNLLLKISQNSPEQLFPCEFCEIFRSIFSTDHLRTITPVVRIYWKPYFLSRPYQTKELILQNNFKLSCLPLIVPT